ncbi:MAG: hypothetical protein KY396_03115 [Actinobacteria bacterium]|nr:hypothetical protein [Actinomycetota bacterium]
MGEDGAKRRRRREEGVLLVIFALVLALFVYSMIDAYALSIDERSSANPFGRRT